MTLGDKNLSPVLPLTMVIVKVLDPATSVPDGIAYSTVLKVSTQSRINNTMMYVPYIWLRPLQVPRVTPRESIFVGAAGVEEVQEFTLTVGRPLANEDVVRMRSVRAPI